VDAAGQVLSPEAAQARLRADIRENLSQVIARREATHFGETLIAQFESRPGETNLLESLASSNGLPHGVTAPFARFERPPGIMVGSEFAEAAFALSPDQPLGLEPLSGQDGIYLIALAERIPGYVPPFEQVQHSVAADYRRQEARKLALEAAGKFFAQATNLLAQGQSFGQVCSNANVIPIQPAAFARSTQFVPNLAGRVELAQLKEAAFDVAPGQLSAVQENRDGAFVVFVASRAPVAADQLEKELPEFMEQLRTERQRTALEEWFRKEVELAQITGLPEQSRRSSTPDEE
jgi:hypothetical protein